MNSTIIKPGDHADNLIFVVRGIIEVYTIFEGNKFIVEHLGPGSIINNRTFFMGDLMYVYMESITIVELALISINTITRIKERHPTFAR